MELFFKYLQYEKRFSPHTITSYQTDLCQFQEYLKEVYDLEDISQADHAIIRSWVVTLVQKDLDSRTIHRKIASLRSFFRFLVQQGKLERNPTLRIKAPKLAKKLPAFIEEDAFTQLLDQSEFSADYKGFRERLILELLYGTGMRLAELTNLKLADIHLASSTLKVLGKGNKERILPLNTSLATSLSQYLVKRQEAFPNNNSPFLFVTDKEAPLYPKYVYRVVKKYMSSVSTAVKNSPHVLRHSFATHLLNRGADLGAIKDLLGHASLAATQVYTHNSIEKLKAVFEKAHPKA
ncbi:tyrosine-type recombinase/integrase [Rufibacter glacialis]|uniref:Tyrosine recombinase XerC n=1 Tax=Rufibacter glacialis TaxID=1259555 RepID=A0A5M8QRE4_9BACT|nr:tyrosine-type recombinase/integrase [Rufibacter glacialis]KAA6437226.1 tyrosine-type recombinase/integrase [Rufibacter glacialis]GGK60951.1 tyrosine recombinase XerC [Rufibacter glacialis]